jgi:uncharacterized membrane protein YcaP (DUF421 family)
MGKRQLGELEISELVSTLLLSNIASLPITNQELPISYAVVPILAITTFEVCASLLLTKAPGLKGLLSTRPSMVIRKGRVDHDELLKNRISIDELISELRQKNITDISEVDYAIIEQNGKMTVIPKADQLPPTRSDLKIHVVERGLSHVIVSDGTVNRYGLQFIQKNSAWLQQELKRRNVALKDVYLLTADDAGTVRILRRDQVVGQKKKGGEAK